MSTLKVTNIQDTSGGNSSTSAQIYSGRAKAWVNFNGQGTVAIRVSFNVSSITDNGTGDYTVNFTTAFADANYAACYGSNSGTIMNGASTLASDYTTSSHRFTCMGRSDSYTQGDPEYAALIYAR